MRIASFMSIFRWMVAVSLLAGLVSCGGGGGSSGDSVFGSGGSGSSGSDSGSSTSSDAAYAVAVEVQRSSSATTSISSTESVQAVATVTTKAGAPVAGVIVTFAESTGLLTFSPSSATALTDSAGKASVDVTGASVSSTGATSISAAATVSGSDYSGARAIQVTTGSVATVTPKAINFKSVVPSGTAIVIKGAGGNGRTESAILTFEVVDENNSPIKGAVVNFSVTPASLVTLNTTTATSNSAGLVTTTVQSGSSPGSVVVTAVAAANSSASAPSDTLLVSTGVAVAGGFEIVAKKYNLDGQLTGDSTTLTAYVVDANGNPVADGQAVSFTTDYGAVASSTLGGCTTSNGTCTVDFRVQNPRGDGLATVVATLNNGTTTLSDALFINMAGATGGAYTAFLDAAGAQTASTLTLSGTCKQAFELWLGDADKLRAPSVGTTIVAGSSSNGITPSITSGSPVADQLASGFPPVGFTVKIEVSTSEAAPVCVAAGAGTASGFANLIYKSSGGVSHSQRFRIVYPTN